jgi:hypothetical protein
MEAGIRGQAKWGRGGHRVALRRVKIPLHPPLPKGEFTAPNCRCSQGLGLCAVEDPLKGTENPMEFLGHRTRPVTLRPR